MNSYSDSYRNAGVDVTAGYRSVELMKSHVMRTMIPGVVSGIGGFGGLFELDTKGMARPTLVSGTDGVGTKLKVAFLLGKHDTVGIDCVAMCANDVVCTGAKPLFFLDYIALGKNIPIKVATIVAGVSEGCVQAGCALIGGETAEMPGFYPVDEYDLAGFCVGIVDQDKIIDGSKLKKGDALIGLYSSGLHSNGFSLVRKVLDLNRKNVNAHVEDFSDSIGETLLTPTRIYVKSILALQERCEIHAISHITGGGFYENIPRMMKEGLTAQVEKRTLPKLPIFDLIEHLGNISEHDMFNTFNMGIGMCVAVPAEQADEALRVLRESGEQAAVIGEVIEGDGGVVIC